MKRLLHLLLLIAFVALGLIFGTMNKAPVTVDYFFFRVEWPLALSLGAFFFVGALFGGLLTWVGSWLTVRRRIRSVKAEAAAADSSRALVVTADGDDRGAPAASTSRG